MKKIIFNIIRLFIFWPIYWLSKIVPKNSQIWCFGAPRERFVDNSKYLFLYLNKHFPEIKCIWVTSDDELKRELEAKGYHVVNRNSLTGIFTIIQAKFVFYSCFVSEVSFWLTGGAKAFNLWHGLPLKKIEFDIASGPLTQKYADSFSWNKLGWQLFNPVSFRRPDYLFSPTEVFDQIFKRCFRMDKGDLIRSGSPRTDMFFENIVEDSEFAIFPEIISDCQKAKKIYLYMPTFRDTGGDFFLDAGFDFSLLNQQMEKLNAVFYIKVHPNAGLDSFSQTEYSSIRVVPSSIDPYPLLAKVDVLITDYSSIYIDFLLLNKPIIFYAFDLENYLSTCRDMYFQYQEVTPGKYAYNFEELLTSFGCEDHFQQERLALKDKFWGKHYVLGYKAIAEKLMADAND